MAPAICAVPMPSNTPTLPTENTHDRSWYGLAVVLVTIVLVQSWLKFYSYQDDAFIFFRYADNVLRGNGAVFNPGERVEGFSSPLWLALLVACGAVGVGPVHAAGVLGTLAALATVLLSLRDARRCGGTGAWLAPVALVLYFPFLAWSVSGMETSLFTALVWAAMSGVRIARAENRALGADVALCLAGAVLTRPEAVLVVLAVLADERSMARERWRSWRSGLKWLWPALLAGVLLEGARLAYYGEWLPNTAYAKLGLGVPHVRLGLRYLGGFLRATPLVWPALLLPLFVRKLPGAVATVVLLASWSAHVVLAGGDFFAYFRFMLPLVPLLFAVGATGLGTLWSRVAIRVAPGRRRMLGGALCLLCFLCVALAAPDPTPGRAQHGFDWTLASAKLGQRMAATMPPSTLVALPHIGAFGYYSHLPVVDLLALVDRQLARRPTHMPARGALGLAEIGHERFDIEWSLARRPALIVPSRSYGSEPFTDLSEVRPDFEAEAQLLQILARRDDYRLVDLPIGDGAHWGVLLRRDLDPHTLTAGSAGRPR
jgi:arabinofuranosyltransferase